MPHLPCLPACVICVPNLLASAAASSYLGGQVLPPFMVALLPHDASIFVFLFGIKAYLTDQWLIEFPGNPLLLEYYLLILVKIEAVPQYRTFRPSVIAHI